MSEFDNIEEVVVTAKRINRRVPRLECPEVQLPTIANLVNLFGDLITVAERNKDSEIDELKEEAKKLKDILEKLRSTVLAPYDPKFKRLEIPEKEYEIMLVRLITEYGTFVQAQIVAIIQKLLDELKIEFKVTVSILGIDVDAVKFAIDRPYRAEILGQINVDSMYDLLPPEYQSFRDKFDSADLRGKKINDFIDDAVKAALSGNIIDGLKKLGLDAFTPPDDPRELVRTAIQEIKADAKKDMQEKIDAIKEIDVAGITLEEIIGGELSDNVDISEFTFDRLVSRLITFAEDFFAYLIKEVLARITEAIKAIPGLDKIIEFLTFTFCDFLTLLGFPKTLALDEFEGIDQFDNSLIPIRDNIIIIEPEENGT